eukprot:358574-Chlamydomonas_euryale.AAC.4
MAHTHRANIHPHSGSSPLPRPGDHTPHPHIHTCSASKNAPRWITSLSSAILPAAFFSMRPSTLWAVTNRNTTTGQSWPMRWQRSIACRCGNVCMYALANRNATVSKQASARATEMVTAMEQQRWQQPRSNRDDNGPGACPVFADFKGLRLGTSDWVSNAACDSSCG